MVRVICKGVLRYGNGPGSLIPTDDRAKSLAYGPHRYHGAVIFIDIRLGVKEDDNIVNRDTDMAGFSCIAVYEVLLTPPEILPEFVSIREDSIS